MVDSAPAGVATSLAFGPGRPMNVLVRAQLLFTVEVRDGNGDVVTDDNTTVVTIGGSTGSVYGARSFGGPLTATAVNGVATFVGNSWPLAETVTFDVTAPSLTGIDDATFVFAHQGYSKVIVTSQSDEVVAVFDKTATGDVAPLRAITGGSTTFNSAWGVAYDEMADEIVVSNYGANKLDRFAFAATGDIAPVSSLVGTATTLAGPSRVFFDYVHDELWIGLEDDPAVLAFARSATGDTAPVRRITGALTTLGDMDSAVVNYETDEVYATGYGSPYAIRVFDRTATGDVAPKRSITGAATQLSSPFELYLDNAHDELMVIDYDTGLLTFAIGATGDVAPIRQIPVAVTTPCEGLAYDAATDEVFLACNDGSVRVFNRTDSGASVTPKRTLTSAATFTSLHDIALGI